MYLPMVSVDRAAYPFLQYIYRELGKNLYLLHRASFVPFEAITNPPALRCVYDPSFPALPARCTLQACYVLCGPDCRDLVQRNPRLFRPHDHPLGPHPAECFEPGKGVPAAAAKEAPLGISFRPEAMTSPRPKEGAEEDEEEEEVFLVSESSEGEDSADWRAARGKKGKKGKKGKGAKKGKGKARPAAKAEADDTPARKRRRGGAEEEEEDEESPRGEMEPRLIHSPVKRGAGAGAGSKGAGRAGTVPPLALSPGTGTPRAGGRGTPRGGKKA